MKNFDNSQIRNIWCIGRNYQDHAKELGNSVPAEPLIFLKAGSSATFSTNEIFLPHWSENIHHEVELAFQLDEKLVPLQACVAIDLTERNLQTRAKKTGEPWTLAKSFKGACALSDFFPIHNISEVENLDLKLWLNEELKQNGNTSQMIFKCDQILKFVKEHFPVCPGDLILTGTPAGVSPLKHGDQIKTQLGTNLTHSWVVFKE